MKKECQSCGGTGKMLVECSSCHGAGTVNGKDCKKCYTQGQVVVACSACHGSGSSDEDEKSTSLVLSLQLSDDGKAIVDDQGNEVAIFREGFSVRPSKEAKGNKLPGHMVCTKECVAWDENGNCVQYVTSCTWEFPPFDF